MDNYTVHIRWQNNNYREIVVPGTNTSLDISDLSENVVYMFAVQPVNDGGHGNMTNYRSGVFCLTSKL